MPSLEHSAEDLTTVPQHGCMANGAYFTFYHSTLISSSCLIRPMRNNTRPSVSSSWESSGGLGSSMTLRRDFCSFVIFPQKFPCCGTPSALVCLETSWRQCHSGTYSLSPLVPASNGWPLHLLPPPSPLPLNVLFSGKSTSLHISPTCLFFASSNLSTLRLENLDTKARMSMVCLTSVFCWGREHRTKCLS